MHSVLEALGKIGIVPVIKIDDATKAVPLAKALIAGGVPCAEITFRTHAGEEAIRRINKEVPDILLGAGTVLSVDQVDRAINAGAKFIVSPGFNPKVVSHCITKGIPITPGCSNPSDIEQALELGLDVVKFFPAEQAGGLDYIKAIAAPYTTLKFLPTGGINAANIANYIAYEKILASGGSWMVTADLINVDDRSIRTILKEVNNDELTLALKAASPQMQEKIFANLSERAADMIKEDLEAMGPTRLADVEKAQQSILRAAKKLEAEGKIVIGKGDGGDQFV